MSTPNPQQRNHLVDKYRIFDECLFILEIPMQIVLSVEAGNYLSWACPDTYTSHISPEIA
jgi:hypothetical protein